VSPSTSVSTISLRAEAGILAGMSHLSVIATLGALAVLTTACGAAPPPPRMSSSSSSSEGFASCPSGSTVVGGGYEIEPAKRLSGQLPIVVSSRPTETGWKVECVDTSGKATAGCRAFVLCAQVL
jgi:hypothetical protein